ncbi:hypothetical protein GUJ93_ZPchr0013g36619 [Zizania palustris]|uniref:Uncharacterized protein n=1 Tax=Zizania palustris TaxID=103762 RepID=A0A8J5WZQ4_ZIZPA|nr:hypothetical protein GUJ93_ZPchr0013g36619 [Zizania palustris]
MKSCRVGSNYSGTNACIRSTSYTIDHISGISRTAVKPTSPSSPRTRRTSSRSGSRNPSLLAFPTSKD